MSRTLTKLCVAMAIACASILPSRANPVYGPVVYHVHSTYSPDSKNDMAYYAALAKSMGIRAFVITDHSDQFICLGTYPASVARASQLSTPTALLIPDPEFTYQWNRKVLWWTERREGHITLSAAAPAQINSILTALAPYQNRYGSNPNLFGGPDLLGSLLGLAGKTGALPIFDHVNTPAPGLDGVIRYDAPTPSQVASFGYRGPVGFEVTNLDDGATPQGIFDKAQQYEDAGFPVAFYGGSDDHGQGAWDLLRPLKWYFSRNNRWTWFVGPARKATATVVTYGNFRLTDCEPTPNESSAAKEIYVSLAGTTNWRNITYAVYGDVACKKLIDQGAFPSNAQFHWKVPTSTTRADRTYVLILYGYDPVLGFRAPLVYFSPFRIH